MRTQLMIGLIVGATALAGVAVVVGLVVWLGWAVGPLVTLAGLALLLLIYFLVIKPWHLRWGATDEEVSMEMPGDELIPEASPATRAITIRAGPDDVWPWLVQLGYGKAGWYSYDWIDNDFKPSADRIIPEHQNLAVGDEILMMPEMGFVVRAIDRPRSIVSELADGSTSLVPRPLSLDGGGTRLVSRWRPNFEITPATFFMIALSEPGAFIMEQKMLRSIRDRAEKAAAT